MCVIGMTKMSCSRRSQTVYAPRMLRLAALIAHLVWSPPTCGVWSDGYRSPQEVRDDTYRRIEDTAQALGMRREARRVLHAIATRESDHDPCAVHTLGVGEYGLGPLGLSIRWTLGHWHSNADPGVLAIPEIATVITARIFRRAVKRHGARTWREVNSVFAIGKIRLRPSHDNRFCHRLSKRGVDCESDPTDQLGTELGLSPHPGQTQRLEELLR